MTSFSEAALVVLGITTAVGIIAAVLLARSRAALAARNRALSAACARDAVFRDEFRHLVTARVPALALNLISSHHPVPGLLNPQLAGTEDAELLDSVLHRLSDTVLKERRRVDAAARAALRGASQDIQALSYRLQTRVDSLQHDYDDPRLLEELFEVDHLNEQVVRLVQKAAIVCGAWPGHVRQDTYVADVVTGASSRLHGWKRIRINSKLLATNVGVVGRAAEPIAVACAEVMANALEHSRDDLSVEVALMQTDNGTVCVTVDDAGKGMTEEAKARGSRLVAAEGAQDLLLTELGDPPALGFAAIGRLVADHGFQVTVDQPSPYGGVRAVVSIPPHLLTEIDEEAEPQSALAPLPAAPPKAPHWATAPADASEPADTAPAPAPAPAPAADDGSGLPQRRRRVRTAPTPVSGPAPEARTPDPDKALETWSQFQLGIATGNADNDTEETP